jgi:cytosine/uracil/thiamine/allantoin permease
LEQEEFRDLAVNNRAELDSIKSEARESSLYNEDLAPTGPEDRTWTTYNIAALWIGMAVVITTYTLASTLMAAGMNWWQALLTISLGNILVLIPMLLNAHAGTKYGVPFPVFVRASFGVRGANFAAMARALVACGWFGIQTWIGGLATDALVTAVWSGWANVPGHSFITFFVFWIIQVAIILSGIEGVKWFESFAAPLLLAGGIALLIWGFTAVGSIGAVFIAMIIIVIAQISTNMAANVVSPSFDFSNLAPKYISFKTGGMITAIIGIISFPWVLYNSAGAYIFTWLVGYSSLLGAIGAVMIADYWILRRRQLSLADLYKHEGRYAYSGGWNWRAIVAVFIGVIPVLPGFLKAATTPRFAGVFENPTFIEGLYNYGLFFTFFVAGLAYLLLNMIPGLASQPRREPEAT